MVDATHEQPSKFIIEVCIDSVESAMAAVRGGANRIELCGNLGYGGGTTPSIGLLQSVKKAVPDVPIMAMIRPRTGDFVYSEGELDVMLQDISAFKEHGVQGVVFGVLTPAGDVDESKVRKLVSAAVPLEVCFHRAIDMTHDLRNGVSSCSTSRHLVVSVTHQSMEIVIQGHRNHEGIDKVISFVITAQEIESHFTASGQCRIVSSPEALQALAWMLDSASPVSTTILPGSGINISTVPILCKALLPHGLEEIHLSGGRWVDGRSAYRPDGMGMGDWSIWRTDEEAIRKVRDFVDRCCATETGGA